jgi:serine/threonine protein kinase
MQNNITALPHGTRLQNGKYAVAQVLGQGEFGVTYKGGNLLDKHYVAIKEYCPAGVIRQGTTIVPSNVTADIYRLGKDDFLCEAQTLKRFEDASIVRVLDTFEENNTAYIVMEFLEGQTLGTRIAEKGKLDEWEALDIGVRLAGALEIIHKAGILHRNIKPDNVMLSRSGRAVLIDFGIVHEYGGVNTPKTQVVTPGYSPIEQYAAQAKRGPATDIYSLGATLYHALSGQQPVAAKDRAINVPLVHLKTLAPQLSPFMASAIMHTLQMDITRRPQSASEFASQLRGQPVSPQFRTPPANSNSISTSTCNVVTQQAAGVANNESRDAQSSRQTMLYNKLERHTATVNALAFSPDGTKLASAGLDKVVNIWSWSGAAISAFIRANEIAVNSLTYSHDGVWLATGGRDKKVFILDGTMKNRVPLAILNDCHGVVNDVCFCPTRSELLVGDEGALTLWDAGTGTIKGRLERGCLALAWSPDGKTIAASDGVDKVLYLLDGQTLETTRQISIYQGIITDLAFSPDGKQLAICSDDGTIQVWDVATDKSVWEQRPAKVPATCVAWSPDGRLLAVGCREIVFLWTAKGELWRQYMKHKDTLRAIAFAPYPPAPFKYVVASASRDKTINLTRILCDEVP